MGGGSRLRGREPTGRPSARAYATAAGTLCCLLGLAGFIANPSFATADAIPAGSVGPVEINGWQSAFYLAAGLTGLALAHPAPRLYCLGAALVWTALVGFGFFGAHGGEPIASMGDRLLATTSNNLVALALAALGWLALAASGAVTPVYGRRRGDRDPEPKRPKSPKSRPTAAKRSKSRPGDRGTAGREASPDSSIGRPRTSTEPRRSRDPIN